MFPKRLSVTHGHKDGQSCVYYRIIMIVLLKAHWRIVFFQLQAPFPSVCPQGGFAQSQGAVLLVEEAENTDIWQKIYISGKKIGFCLICEALVIL